MTDETEVEEARFIAARKQFPLLDSCVYLNSGWASPVAKVSHAAFVNSLELELSLGRGDRRWVERAAATHSQVRADFARIWGCGPDAVALTSGTTEGLNIALNLVSWSEGDELVIGDEEHGAALVASSLLRTRRGVRVRSMKIGSDTDGCEPLDALVTGRTRAVLISNVTWSTGIIRDLSEISERAHAVGALVICDGAQSCGAIPVSVNALGVDCYATSGQKWLCGPIGTGALYVRPGLAALQVPVYGGSDSARRTSIGYDLHDDARRYESRSISVPSLVALHAVWEFLESQLGWDAIYRRIRSLTRYCYQLLSECPVVDVITPADSSSGLISFRVRCIEPDLVVAGLSSMGIVIRAVHDPSANRASIGFFNTKSDCNRLVTGLEKITHARRTGSGGQQ